VTPAAKKQAPPRIQLMQLAFALTGNLMASLS